MEHKNEKVRLLALATKLLLGQLDILLELAHGVLQGRPRVINLVDDENVLADQVGHLEGAEIQPLGAGDLGAGDLFGVAAAEVLIEREADGLDGDVGLAGALEEGPVRMRLESGRGSDSRGRCGHTGGYGQGRSRRRRWRS